MPCERIEDDLFRRLGRHWGQAERPVVPWILLTALPVDGHHIGQLHLSETSLVSQGLMINDGQQLSKLSHHLPWLNTVWS